MTVIGIALLKLNSPGRFLLQHSIVNEAIEGVSIFSIPCSLNEEGTKKGFENAALAQKRRGK